MTNCGNTGWVTDRSGYRYDGIDPDSGQPWPAMPAVFRKLAEQAAVEGGFENFAPDACLINRYAPGSADVAASGQGRAGFRRADRIGIARTARDIPVRRPEALRQDRAGTGWSMAMSWSGAGPSRLFFHGVAPLADGEHAMMGRQRINLTFRKAR